MAAHRYWRWYFTNSGSGYVTIGEAELRLVAGGPDITGPGIGTVTADSTYSGWPVSNVFANNGSGYSGAYCWATANGTLPHWIKIDFGAGNTKNIIEYVLTVSTFAPEYPTNWVFQYSDNNSSWTTVHTVTNQNWSTPTQVFNFAPHSADVSSPVVATAYVTSPLPQIVVFTGATINVPTALVNISSTVKEQLYFSLNVASGTPPVGFITIHLGVVSLVGADVVVPSVSVIVTASSVLTLLLGVEIVVPNTIVTVDARTDFTIPSSVILDNPVTSIIVTGELPSVSLVENLIKLSIVESTYTPPVGFVTIHLGEYTPSSVTIDVPITQILIQCPAKLFILPSLPLMVSVLIPVPFIQCIPRTVDLSVLTADMTGLTADRRCSPYANVGVITQSCVVSTLLPTVVIGLLIQCPLTIVTVENNKPTLQNGVTFNTSLVSVTVTLPQSQISIGNNLELPVSVVSSSSLIPRVVTGGGGTAPVTPIVLLVSELEIQTGCAILLDSEVIHVMPLSGEVFYGVVVEVSTVLIQCQVLESSVYCGVGLHINRCAVDVTTPAFSMTFGAGLELSESRVWTQLPFGVVATGHVLTLPQLDVIVAVIDCVVDLGCVVEIPLTQIILFLFDPEVLSGCSIKPLDSVVQLDFPWLTVQTGVNLEINTSVVSFVSQPLLIATGTLVANETSRCLVLVQDVDIYCGASVSVSINSCDIMTQNPHLLLGVAFHDVTSTVVVHSHITQAHAWTPGVDRPQGRSLTRKFRIRRSTQVNKIGRGL